MAATKRGVDAQAISRGILQLLRRTWVADVPSARAAGGGVASDTGSAAGQPAFTVDYAADAPFTLLEEGNEVNVFRFGLSYTGTPPVAVQRVPAPGAPLVARVFLLRSVGAHRLATFEGCVHNGLRDKGFPTPRVWLAADSTPEAGSVLVMDYVDGAPVMAAERIQKGAAIAPFIRSLKLTFVEMPHIVGTTAANLHNTRPDRVLERLADAGLKPTDVNFKAWLDGYKARVAAIANSVCPSFADMYAWLVEHYRPSMDDPAIATVCHGDLFPPNILMSRNTPPGSEAVVPVAGVIDWSCAVVTSPAFDVGVCQGGFEGAHVSCPPALQWLANYVKRSIGRRFVRRYRECVAHVPGASERWQFNDTDVAYFKVVRYLFAMTPFLESRIEGYKAQRYLLSLPAKSENEYMAGMCRCVRDITGVSVHVPVLAVPQPSSASAWRVRVFGVFLLGAVLGLLWLFVFR